MPEPALAITHAAAARPAEDGRTSSIAGNEDDMLVRGVLRGDPRAFDRLHRRYAPLVHGILLSRVPPDDADDLLQEVFVLALRKIGTLRDTGAIGPWLARIARNAAIRFHRDRRTLAPLPDGLPARHREEPPELREARVVLERIAALPEAYRETLVLRLVEGLNGPQIARATGMTPGSVRVNLHRGMKLLREGLEGEL